MTTDTASRNSRRVVVTGLGAVSPLGNDVRTTWEALARGRSGIARIARFDPSPFASQFAGEVREFDPLAYMDRKDARRCDRSMAYAVAAAAQAIADARLDGGVDRDRAGVAVASALGGVETLADQVDLLHRKGPSRVSPYGVFMSVMNAPAAQVSLQFGLRGPTVAHVSACASSAHSLGEAAETIRRGHADVMVAGGSEASVVPVVIAAFCAMTALSRRNDAPERASRPFDAGRDGFVLAEGAAMLVLEELEHARRRGARVYAELAGYGTTTDAHHITAPLPQGAGSQQAMRIALGWAGLAPSAVDYVNAHGTSTQDNDREETRALKGVFGAHARTLAVSSTKSMTGHLLGAAGALEAIVCVLAIRESCVPPTINYETPDPDCDLDYVPNAARAMRVEVALSNSMGFGGHNASLIFRELGA